MKISTRPKGKYFLTKTGSGVGSFRHFQGLFPSHRPSSHALFQLLYGVLRTEYSVRSTSVSYASRAHAGGSAGPIFRHLLVRDLKCPCPGPVPPDMRCPDPSASWIYRVLYVPPYSMYSTCRCVERGIQCRGSDDTRPHSGATQSRPTYSVTDVGNMPRPEKQTTFPRQWSGTSLSTLVDSSVLRPAEKCN
jgi:hypothetical protein